MSVLPKDNFIFKTQNKIIKIQLPVTLSVNDMNIQKRSLESGCHLQGKEHRPLGR